nr:hypothetical protein BaRGS_021159 [Batillaria attramentaria]
MDINSQEEMREEIMSLFWSVAFNRDAANRPVSVDEGNCGQQFSQSQQSLVSEEIASQLTSSVKLRNSPSPKQERPKSDFTVRWADLLEQVKETNVTYRREGNKTAKATST